MCATPHWNRQGLAFRTRLRIGWRNRKPPNFKEMSIRTPPRSAAILSRHTPCLCQMCDQSSDPVRRVSKHIMKRSVIAPLLVGLACCLTFLARSSVDRNWAFDGPGGKFGCVETRLWRITQENASPQLIRSRTVLLGPARFPLTDTGAQLAGAGFAVLAIRLWSGRGSREASVKY